MPLRTQALEARQVEDRVVLNFPAPLRKTDGSTTPGLRELRIYRLARPRPDSAAPPDAAAFRSEAVQIASLLPEQLASHRSGDRISYPDTAPLPDDVPPHESTLYYAVEFLGSRERSDGLSNILKILPLPLPWAPASLRATLTQEAVRLEWDPPQANRDGSRPANIAGYNVYRSLDSPARFGTPLNAAPLQQRYFEDRDMVFGRDASYAVSVVGSLSEPRAESAISAGILVQPRDTFPPAVPQRVELFGRADSIFLRWDAGSEADLAGYFVYRSEREAEPGARLNAVPVADAGYLDQMVQAGKTYYYRVSAVDRLGNESPATGPVAGGTLPP